MSQPRIPPRPAEEWDAEVLDALTVLSVRRGVAPRAQQEEPGRRPVSNVIATFAWHPALTKSWLTFSNHLFDSTLSERVRELVTVRTAWLRRGEYEWAQHVRLAQAAGMSSQEVEAISEGPDSKVWGPLDAALLRAVDEVCVDRNISDATWEQLATHLNRKQLMDLVFTIGAYDLHVMAFNTFGLEMDPGLEGFPAGNSV